MSSAVRFAVGAGLVAIVVGLPALAQEAAEPAASSENTALPPLEVTAKKSPAKKAAKVKAQQPAAAASPVPSQEEFTAEAEAQLQQQWVSSGNPQTNKVMGNLPPAYAGGQVAVGGQLGLLGNRSIFESPFSQTNYTNQTIENEQAKTVADILLNDPSVTPHWPAGSFVDNIAIRGFTMFSFEMAYNGLYGVGGTNVMGLESVERVELFKGPNALLNGIPPWGGVGGAVNLVPKRAKDEPTRQITTSFESSGNIGTHLDLGQRFGANKEWGVRFNGSYRDGDLEVDHQSEEFAFGSLGLDYRGERVRLSADLIYQDQDYQAPRSQVYVNDGLPALRAPDNDSNYAQPWEYTTSLEKIAIFRGEFDITDNWTAFAAFGVKDGYDVQVRNIALVDETGSFADAPYYYRGKTEALSGEAGVRGTFDTGPLSHSVSAVYSRLFHEYGELCCSNIVTPPSNIYDPVFIPRPDYDPVLGKIPTLGENDLESVALADSISLFDNRLIFIAGVRFQNVSQANFDGVTGATTYSYEDDAVTPAYGIVVRPLQNLSLYANYIEGLQPGAIAPPGTANSGQIFAPYVTDQKEVGAKLDFGKLAFTAALFDTAQPSGIVNDQNFFVIDGEERHRGIELTTFGELTESIRILGGVMFLDAELANTEGGTFDGNTAPGQPRMQISMSAEWDTPFMPGLTLTGRVVHYTEQKVDYTNVAEIPDWTRFDLGARYTFEYNGKPVVLRGSVENVADLDYWAGARNGYLYGTPRTFRLSTTVDF